MNNFEKISSAIYEKTEKNIKKNKKYHQRFYAMYFLPSMSPGQR